MEWWMRFGSLLDWAFFFFSHTSELDSLYFFLAKLTLYPNAPVGF